MDKREELIGKRDAREEIEISLKHKTGVEVRTKTQLQKLLKEYNLSKWMITKKIVIDEQLKLSRSYPVLTLSTRHLNNDLRLLSTFIHEQIHWFLIRRKHQAFKAIEELKTIFTVVPVGYPEGGKDEFSTYVHIIVNYLEYEAMKELVGVEKAMEVMKFWLQNHYTWIYKTVLNEGAKIKATVEEYSLNP